MNSELKALRNYARRWGGDLREVTPAEFATLFRDQDPQKHAQYHRAPFSSSDLGVDWGNKQVLYSARRPVRWPEVIHEMGHVFACTVIPHDADEAIFFGWEYTLAQRIGNLRTWIRSNADYVIQAYDGERVQEDDLRDFGKLSSKERESTLKYHVGLSKEHGLIGSRGAPLAIR